MVNHSANSSSAGSGPHFQASPSNPATTLLVLGAIAGLGAALLLYSGATAIEMGGLALLVGMVLSVVAVCLLIAGLVARFVRARLARRSPLPLTGSSAAHDERNGFQGRRRLT